MKELLASLVLGTLACANVSGNGEIRPEEQQISYPTIFIENWRWESLKFFTQHDSLGTVRGRGRSCFEIRQKGNIILRFEYFNEIYGSPPFNPGKYMGGHRVTIGMRPKEDIMVIAPSRKCFVGIDYNEVEF